MFKIIIIFFEYLPHDECFIKTGGDQYLFIIVIDNAAKQYDLLSMAFLRSSGDIGVAF